MNVWLKKIIKSNIRLFTKFGLTGAMGFCVSFTCLSCMVHILAWNPYASWWGSYLLANLLTWQINGRFTFRLLAKGWLAMRQGGTYLAYGVLGAALNYGIYCSLVALVPFFHHYPNLATIPACGSAMFLNYFNYKRRVFKVKTAISA